MGRIGVKNFRVNRRRDDTQMARATPHPHYLRCTRTRKFSHVQPRVRRRSNILCKKTEAEEDEAKSDRASIMEVGERRACLYSTWLRGKITEGNGPLLVS